MTLKSSDENGNQDWWTRTVNRAEETLKNIRPDLRSTAVIKLIGTRPYLMVVRDNSADPEVRPHALP